jgi:simple sugar transport system ATP-binding protein
LETGDNAVDSNPNRQTPTPVLEARGVVKRFGALVANDHVNLQLYPGEVLALLGENGAGKTTLMSILAGLYRSDSGQTNIDGQQVTFHSPKDAIQHGVGMVYQHYRLVASQTVAENLLLGLPGVPFRLNAGTFIRQARELGERYHLRVDPSRPVWQLSVGEQQRVEILKTLQRGARILILDEPTAVLTPHESGELMLTLRQVAAEGRTVILISHKLEEVRAVADRVTVLRGGTVVAGGLPIGELSARDLARLMVGDESPSRTSATEQSGHPPAEPRPLRGGEETAPDARLVLEGVSALDDRGLEALKSVHFSVAAGEIFGIAGVAGNGQRELAQVVTGLRATTTGKLWLDGREITRLDSRERTRRGVAHIPEDRLGEGLVGNLPVADNAILRFYDRPVVARGWFLDTQRVVRFTQSLLERFGIRARPDSTTRLLSGGQLQRLLLAREMALEPRLIVAVHPTRGLDVAATGQVQAWLTSTSASGTSVLLISEDLDEILQLSHRVAVMYEGQIVGVLSAKDAERETIGLMMAGSHPSTAQVA